MRCSARRHADESGRRERYVSGAILFKQIMGYAPNHYTLCSPRSSMEPARALLPITSQTNTLRTHMPYVRRVRSSLLYAGTVSAEDDPSPLSFAFSASATTAPIITSRTYPYLSKAPASMS